MLALTALLVLPALGQEEGAIRPEHDAAGFPVTFNAEVITRNDVLRSLPPDQARGEGAVISRLEQILMDKVTERIGQIWRIEIHEQRVADQIRIEAEKLGGEVKFYQWLDQRGVTLEQYRQDLQIKILRFFVYDFMLTHGRAPNGTLLPWDIEPTPEEVRIAFEHELAQQEGGPRVKFLPIEIRLTLEERKQLVGRQLVEGKSDEWLEQEMSRRVLERAREVIAELESGKPMVEVATSRAGLDAEALLKRWIPLPAEPSEDPVVRFAQTAPAGTWSEPMPRPEGSLLILCLVERQEAGEMGPGDREVYVAYRERIRVLRRRKVRALMQLQALDRSDVRPERVLKDFRSGILADLKDAQESLEQLGLH